MGLLTVGKALSWDEAAPYRKYVLEHGIAQFLHIFNTRRSGRTYCLMWGDEIEYYVVHLDRDARVARLHLSGRAIMERANEEDVEKDFVFHPEFGRFMVESTPGQPYTATMSQFALVEKSMRERRAALCVASAAGGPAVHVMTFAAYPRMGVGLFTMPPFAPNGPVARSLFTPDEAINEHPRFPALTANIRLRRGANVAINPKAFIDKDTVIPQFVEQVADPTAVSTPTAPLTPMPDAAAPGSIYMDSMCFGMGMCCTQMTFQACCIDEARDLYDQLAVLSPIMMALSACSPAFRGMLADVDCRWGVISASVDDRTDAERGVGSAASSDGRPLINKSRYDSIDCYISRSPLNLPRYNDLDLVFDAAVHARLTESGVDDLLARHVAHLYIRDPLVIVEGLIEEVDDAESAVHFENIQSTNWQTVRFKPPPPGADMGWRVEFRAMEVQLTDFENASLVIFVVLLTRVILSFKLNFYIPISAVDANMATAQRRDAVVAEEFYFRNNVFAHERSAPATPSCAESFHPPGAASAADEVYSKMSIAQIMNGSPDGAFPGLVQLIHSYLDSLDMIFSERDMINRHLNLIAGRASGRLMTDAAWMRGFVHAHPEYKRDSLVSEGVNFDLMESLVDLAAGRAAAPALFGDLDHYPASPSVAGACGAAASAAEQPRREIQVADVRRPFIWNEPGAAAAVAPLDA